ncbi:LamG-like jellyroll fold domain-containing protein [Gorillibacterium sp. sgz5001074]|uniref:LamG-like jellyroll fold domain-containing protein n=1 Tax=Gorillibacterium sp. sgz5001074 TaxID=3446695 RepID=UPI003F6779FC
MLPYHSAGHRRKRGRVWLTLVLLLSLLVPALPPPPAYAEEPAVQTISNLSVTPSSSQALQASGYQFTFQVLQELHPGSDYFYVVFPDDFEVHSASSIMMMKINGGNHGGASFLPTYNGQEYQISMPTTVYPGDTVTLELNSANAIQIRNPGRLNDTGSYPVQVRANEDPPLEATLHLAYGSPVDNPVLTVTPAELSAGNTNEWRIDFGTSRALETGDVIHLTFPAGTFYNFDYDNLVYDDWGETPAFRLNGTAPTYVKHSGNDILLPVESTQSGTANTLVISEEALYNPEAGSYQALLSVTPNNGPIGLSYTVVPSRLMAAADNPKQYASNVTYTLTYRPRSVIDDSGSKRLVLQVPEHMMLNTDNVTINGAHPQAVGEDGGGTYYINPAPGSLFTPDDALPMLIVLHGMQNPPDEEFVEFRAHSDGQPIADLAKVALVESSPSYNPALFGESLAVSPTSYVKLPSGTENNFSGDSHFSIGLWIKPASTGGTQTLYYKGSGGVDQLVTQITLNEGKIVAGLGRSSFTADADWNTVTSEADVVPGEWTHVALSYNGHNFTLSINGIESGHTDEIEAPFQYSYTSEQPVYIGNDAEGLTPFTGRIDDLQIFHDSFYSEWWKGYMYSGDMGYSAPASRYTFETAQSGGVLADSTGTRHAVYVTGAAYPTADYHVVKNIPRSAILPSLDVAGITGYEIVASPSHGTAELTDVLAGTFLYSPAADYTGTDSFLYKVNGADGAAAEGRIVLKVEENRHGTDSTNADLAFLSVNGYSLPLSPAETVLNWNVPPGTFRALIQAYGNFDQEVTVGQETITPYSGKDWDLTETDNPVPITVDSYDHTVQKHYTLNIHIASYAEIMEQAFNTLTESAILGSNTGLSQVTGNLSLPSFWSNASVTWTSTNPGYLSPYGIVNRPAATASDVSLILTATLTAGGENRTKTFNVTIKKQDAPVVTAPVMEALYAGSSANSLTALAATGLHRYAMTVTGSTYVYLSPAAADAIIYVGGQSFTGAPVEVALLPDQLNTIAITLSHPADPSVYEVYFVEVTHVTPGTAPVVTGASYGGSTFPISGSGIHAVVPAGDYPALFTIEGTFSGSPLTITGAWTGTDSVTQLVYGGNTLTVPFHNAETSVSFTVHGSASIYQLAVTPQTTPPAQEPVLTTAILGANGMDLTLWFDRDITGLDPSKLTITSGTNQVLFQSSGIAASNPRTVKVVLQAPLSYGQSLRVLLQQGTVTSNGQANPLADRQAINLSMYTGGTAEVKLDIAKLADPAVNWANVPPAVIREVLNSIAPRFRTLPSPH